MNRLPTALLVLAAIALAVFVGTTSRWRFSPERLNTVGSPLFRFDPAEIEGITIKNGDISYTIEQSGEGWRISTGSGDEASPAMVQSLMQVALETPILDRIDTSEVRDEKNLATFGVNKSSLQIDFRGDKPGTLLIGKNSPDGTRTYVSFKNSKTVYLVPRSLADLISIDPASFRERRLLTIDPSTIDRIIIRNSLSIIELKRNGGTWHILKPVHDQASAKVVHALIDSLSQIAIQSFTQKKSLRENSGETIAYAGSIELHSLAADEPLLITFIRPDEMGLRSVELKPRNVSGRISPDSPNLTDINLDALRDRSLAHVNPDMVDIVKIRTPSINLLIKRDGDAWDESSINVDDLIQTLADTRVSAYRPATPSALEELGINDAGHRIEFSAFLSENTAEALAGEHSVLTLDIGSPQPDGTLPVLISGSPEIRFVPTAFLDAIGAL